MKKKRFIISLILFTSLLLPFNAFAYEIPSDCYYVNVQTQELGEVMIYVPYNMARYLSYNENNNHIINTNSSQITAYGYTGGSWYSIRFPFLDTPTYRCENVTGSQYNDLNITSLNETNITFLNDTDFTAFSSGTLSNLAMLLIGGSILLCLFMRR